MFDERRELLTESAGVRGAEIDLVLRAAEPEPQRLIGGTAV
jgi:hypothetical protein